MLKQNQYSILGRSSLVLGIFNILISAALYWAILSYAKPGFAELATLQIKIVKFVESVEMVTKPLGLFLGVLGLYPKRKKKTIAIIGIAINLIIIIWTLALKKGLFI